jgi:hypothetical protein
MPQTANARINFGDIMQAIEDRLVLDGVVNNAAQISWGTPGNVPQLSGPFDVLLIARSAQHTPYDGGASDLRLRRLLDVWYRSQAILDPGGGYKSWIKETFAAGDKIIDSVGDDEFWPEDTDGNLLTIESIKLVGDVAPDYPTGDAVFGDYVGTLECKYFPKVNPAKGIA